MLKQFIEPTGSLEVPRVGREIYLIIPFQSVLKRLSADIARTYKRPAPHLLILNMASEEVSFQMKTAPLALVNTHLSSMVMQQNKLSERLRISDIQIIACENADTGRIRFSLERAHQIREQ